MTEKDSEEKNTGSSNVAVAKRKLWAQVITCFKHVRRVLFVFQILFQVHNSVSPL